VISKATVAPIVIVTALPLELDAVSRHVENLTNDTGDDGTRYVLGDFKGASVAIALTGAGNVDAAIETTKAINRFDPRYLLFVGIAGGIKDVKIGDVVAATRIYSYESGKYAHSERGLEFLPRPKMGESSHFLVQLAHSAARSKKWRDLLTGESRGAAAHVGPIVAGEKLVAAIEAPELELIRRTYSDALALEMEGFGVLRVGYSRERVRMAVVRGISDLIVKKEETDSAGHQLLASKNAAAFAFLMIETILEDRKPISPELWQSLETFLVQRYPTGPTHNEIWDRAGGDLSSLDLSQNGQARWHSALNKLRLGGGGHRITFSTLLGCMMDEYPNNPELADLLQAVT
jgi:adenosylhomocysteine nucleosidase